MKNKPIAFAAFVGLILYCAFSDGGFLGGMKVLGEIINIFGTVVVWFVDFIFSIPELAQEITKRVLTTLLVWGFYGLGLRGMEKKLTWGIMGGVASVICTVLSWIGMF